MSIEYERKYRVTSDAWREYKTSHTEIEQGYLANGENAEIRVRRLTGAAVITIKSKSVVDGIGRLEYEYPVPASDASEILQNLASNVIHKTRFTLDCMPGQWTVDVFHGSNDGLVMLEVESDQPFEIADIPEWVGQEVTQDPKYKNSYLAAHPFSSWATSESK